MKIIILSLLISSSTFAKSFKGEAQVEVVIEEKTLEDQRKFYSFKKCYTHSAHCQYLGPWAFYAMEDLERLLAKEGYEIFYSIGGIAASVVVGFVGGAITGASIYVVGAKTGLIAIKSSTQVLAYSNPGFIAGSILTPVISSKKFDAMNPVEQYKQYRDLKSALYEKDSILNPLTNQQVISMANNLELILNKLRQIP